MKQFKDINIRYDTIKILEENIGKTFSDINHSNIFLDQSPKTREIKAKINKWDLVIFKRFCAAKETTNKKATHGMGENICKRCDQQGVNFQNIQRAPTTQHQKMKNNPIKNGQKALIDISPKKAYKWSLGT